MRVVAQLCPRLKSLDLSWSKISDDGIVSLTRGVFHALESVNLTVWVRLTEENIEQICPDRVAEPSPKPACSGY